MNYKLRFLGPGRVLWILNLFPMISKNISLSTLTKSKKTHLIHTNCAQVSTPQHNQLNVLLFNFIFSTLLNLPSQHILKIRVKIK